ncbi:MAG TPA: hypothetical protein VLK82_23660, partial [Candidatus Tectomicrobia bacterium]|nr:hypothetical protein [Candidatus Tectomicrobia bacterium]
PASKLWVSQACPARGDGVGRFLRKAAVAIITCAEAMQRTVQFWLGGLQLHNNPYLPRRLRRLCTRRAGRQAGLSQAWRTLPAALQLAMPQPYARGSEMR